MIKNVTKVGNFLFFFLNFLTFWGKYYWGMIVDAFCDCSKTQREFIIHISRTHWPVASKANAMISFDAAR